jgi:hypothetical protein
LALAFMGELDNRGFFTGRKDNGKGERMGTNGVTGDGRREEAEELRRALLEKMGRHVLKDGMELLFYVTLAAGLYEAGLILWDLFTMMPWFVRLTALKEPNTLTAFSELSNTYLGFLVVYSGGKMAKRWFWEDTAKLSVEDMEEQVEKFSRGTAITFAWQGILLLCLLAKGQHWVPRLPYEVFRVAMQSLALWGGTYVAGKSRNGKVKKLRKTAEQELVGAAQLDGEIKHARRTTEEHYRIVREYLDTGEWINSEKCMEIAGLNNTTQAARLLERLHSEDDLECEGQTKGKKYRKKRKPDAPGDSPEPPQ